MSFLPSFLACFPYPKRVIRSRKERKGRKEGRKTRQDNCYARKTQEEDTLIKNSSFRVEDNEDELEEEEEEEKEEKEKEEKEEEEEREKNIHKSFLTCLSPEFLF